ncbi:Hypothetical protein D9617_25g061770 [Elsinoe fawcettii]|nr:Hypothetical protein D9617_25g061770 [Elsinoe fawcettii]
MANPLPYTYQPVDAQYQIPFEQRLDPPAMPQWPSQLTGDHSSMYKTMGMPPQSTLVGPEVFPGMMPPTGPGASGTPNPRRTLTDDDRRDMCIFAEENPTLKQIEIGARFKVDRSTVSKVLRHKEKYLANRSQRRPSVTKREKSHRTEVESALQNWARKQRKSKMPLTEDVIRVKAAHFATAAGGGEASNPATSASWVSHFKRSYSYSGSSRKTSLPGDDYESMSYTGSNESRSPSIALSPAVANLRMITSNEDLRSGHASDSNSDPRSPSRAPSMSLASAVKSEQTDFSQDFFSDSSPFFTPISSVNPNTFSARHVGRHIASAAEKPSDRQRRSTFPQVDMNDYLPTCSTDASMAKLASTTMLDSPMDNYDALLESPEEHYYQDFSAPTSIHTSAIKPETISPTEMMNPPPLPAKVRHHRASSSSHLPSQEEARAGLNTAMRYLQKHPTANGLLENEEAQILAQIQARLNRSNA